VTTAIPKEVTYIFEEKLGRLYREHFVMMTRAAFWIARNQMDAEDAVQNIFLRFIEHGFPEDLATNPKGYLYQAAVNEAKSIVRARKRQPFDGRKDWAEIPVTTPGLSADKGLILEEALAELGDRAAAVLLLHDRDGYNCVDIGKMFGMTENAVNQMLLRSRARIRQLLGEDKGDDK
jgi:RNA polymerase sigma-70 factor (ECF subfamily)